MQAKLPDLNAAIVRYRSNLIYCVAGGDYYGASVSFNAINALLPDEYRLKINTEKYEDAVKNKTFVVCYDCKTEYLEDSIVYQNVHLTQVQQLITSQQFEKQWFCKTCDGYKRGKLTHTKTVKFEQPCYLGIIPNIPKHQSGIEGNQYDLFFKNWIEIALPELEAKIGSYRADYAAQNSEDEMPHPED